MRPSQAHHIPRKLDRGTLPPQANARKRNPTLANVVNRLDLSLDASFAESTWHQNPVVPGQQFRRSLALDLLALNPPDAHLALVMNARVVERLINRLVRVFVLGV